MKVRVVQGVKLGVAVRPGSREGVRVTAKSGEAATSPEGWREKSPRTATTKVMILMI